MAKYLSIEEIVNAAKELSPEEQEHVLREIEKLKKERQQVIGALEALVKAGLLDKNQITYPWDRPALPELLQLSGKPLSEIVIEDRGTS